jgi:hypothetical protein
MRWRRRKRAAAGGETRLWVALAVAAVIALPVAYLLLPTQLVGNDLGTKPQVAKARNDARTSSVQLVSAMVVALGLVLTARTFLLARQGQLTERFSNASDQLGHVEVAVRLGGIYALGRLARDADAGLRHQVRQILAAYVRTKAPWPADPSRIANDPPAVDVQAALTVLTGVAIDGEPLMRSVDLGSCDLRAADLREADLRGVRLAESHLEWADLSLANLSNVSLVTVQGDHIDLTGATLRGAKLHGARLRGAVLKGAHLEGAELDAADLTDGADLTGATGAELGPAITDDTTVHP